MGAYLETICQKSLGNENYRKRCYLGGNVAGASLLAAGTAPVWLPYVAPTANMVGRMGKQALQGLDWLFNPTTYRGAVLSSAVAADGINNFKENPNIVTGIEAGSGLLPFGPAFIKGVFPLIKFTANKALNIAAKTGNNYARNRIINRKLNQQIKNFNGTVSENYFNSPYNWYRITESPEVYGIKEMGKNVTTTDDANMYIPSNQFRLGVIDNNLTFRDGYQYKPLKRVFNFSKRKVCMEIHPRH